MRISDWSSDVCSSDLDFALVDRIADMFDEPFADASALPTYRVCELAREEVTVALSGDGADEAFAGYRRLVFQHQEEKLRGLIPGFLRRGVLGDRKSVVSGKSVSVRVDLGGRRIIQKKNK